MLGLGWACVTMLGLGWTCVTMLAGGSAPQKVEGPMGPRLSELKTCHLFHLKHLTP